MGSFNNYGCNIQNQTQNNYGRANSSASDLIKIATELSELRIAMRAMLDNSPERESAIGRIAEAEIAAKKNDEKTMLQNLRSAGEWAFKVATDIGTSVAAESIKKAMGL